MEKHTIKVQGMSCEHCVKAVTEAIAGLPGLSGINVDLAGGIASFSYEPAKTGLEKIKAAVVDAGYEVAEG